MDEKEKILRVMKKYGGYFRTEHRDVAFSTKGEYFFYAYSERYKNYEAFVRFNTAEELEKIIIGEIAEDIECVMAVATEDCYMRMQEVENEVIYDGDYNFGYHIAKVAGFLEVFLKDHEHFREQIGNIERSLKNICDNYGEGADG